MTLNKTHFIVFIVGAVLGLLSGFFTGKAIYDQPIHESVTRDTVTITDTIPQYFPVVRDSATVKYVTRYLPMLRTDTVTKTEWFTMHDTVAVEVPITSKHYGSEQYDAWVSGFEPNLDSIKVYQKTEYITETITRMKPPNKWELDLVGGINYNFDSKNYTPHVGGEFLYKPNRLKVGVRGGIEYRDRVEPVIGGVVKIRIL